ncbi:netrin receptor UNC5C-like [Lytechinus pictus]|uniref:netrin receptor UNC5C-like n=1 Tax=Lytechinus pictus TaxID=7653 RepID=UPI0030B9F36A
MNASVTSLPSYVIGRVVMKMLNQWLQKCGTRDRLLAIAQAFRFNDAAKMIAEALGSQPSYPNFISHCNVDHRGGTLALDQLGVTLSIPEGAIPKGMRSVVTLQVSTHDAPRIPLRDGEVLVTPVIETSLTQELLKPCKVVLPHCISLRGRSDDCSTILHTKTKPRTFGRRSLTRGTSHTAKSEIVFHTRHLQVLALSSSDSPGVQLRCVVFQPIILTPEEEPRLRVYIVHPYRIYMKHISRKERNSSVPYCQVQKEFQFSIQPTSKHLKIILQDGGKVQKRMMPIKGILSGECDPLIFKLQFSAEEKGNKDLNITIQEDLKRTAEKQISISIEDEPDYAVDNITDTHQHFASNNLLEVLADVIHKLKDLTSLGYQLGFSHQSMRKYNFDKISRSGLIEMLSEWRRRVRPSEQVEELHLALQNAGLEYLTDVIFREMGGASRKKFERLKQKWESRSKKISN